MTKIYYIELDESIDIYDDAIRVHDKCFGTYEKAKEYLSVHFDFVTTSNGESFKLKSDHNYISDFKRNTWAEIKCMDLIK